MTNSTFTGIRKYKKGVGMTTSTSTEIRKCRKKEAGMTTSTFRKIQQCKEKTLRKAQQTQGIESLKLIECLKPINPLQNHGLNFPWPFSVGKSYNCYYQPYHTLKSNCISKYETQDMQCRQVMHRRALNPFYHLSPLPSQRIEPLQSLYCPHYYPPSLPFLASLHLKAIICNPFLPRVSIIRSSQLKSSSWVSVSVTMISTSSIIVKEDLLLNLNI